MTKAVKHKRTVTRLPPYVKKLFWEYGKRKISWPADRKLITVKVMEYGGWDAITWLRGMTSPEELREWFYRTRGRALDPPRLRFWELKLGLPHRQVDEWIRDMLQNPWHRRFL